jgi:hypothetical protein
MNETRAKFIADRMGDLPAVYRNLMPQTDDPEQLKTAEGDVRRQYAEDAARLRLPGRFQITAKDSRFAGELCGVRFTAGVGWTNERAKLAWFKEVGCTVTDHASH